MRTLRMLGIAVLLAACSSTTSNRASTTSVAAPSTAEAAPATTALAPEQGGGVFLLHDSGSDGVRMGPFLAPVLRAGVDTFAARLQAMATVTAAEAADGFTTAVPAATKVNSATIDGFVATVDLSSDFASGGGALSMSARLAQLVYTATTGPEKVYSVVLLLDGQQVTTFSAEGLELSQPLSRSGYDDLLPGILVEVPAAYAVVDGTISVGGTAIATDAKLHTEILDPDGTVVADVPFVMSSSATGAGSFYVTLTLPSMAAGTPLRIHVWDDRAPGGGRTSERYVPITYG